MSHEEIIGIILAAGESKRFGMPKQLLTFGDTTLLGQVLRNANTSVLDRVVAVMGAKSGEAGHAGHQ